MHMESEDKPLQHAVGLLYVVVVAVMWVLNHYLNSCLQMQLILPADFQVLDTAGLLADPGMAMKLC